MGGVIFFGMGLLMYGAIFVFMKRLNRERDEDIQKELGDEIQLSFEVYFDRNYGLKATIGKGSVFLTNDAIIVANAASGFYAVAPVSFVIFSKEQKYRNRLPTLGFVSDFTVKFHQSSNNITICKNNAGALGFRGVTLRKLTKSNRDKFEEIYKNIIAKENEKH